jgi:hypothetical protein
MRDFAKALYFGDFIGTVMLAAKLENRSIGEFFFAFKGR